MLTYCSGLDITSLAHITALLQPHECISAASQVIVLNSIESKNPFKSGLAL